ncbi:hypothetical protein EJB05_00099, partial [Eragrostis curvula]
MAGKLQEEHEAQHKKKNIDQFFWNNLVATRTRCREQIDAAPVPGVAAAAHRRHLHAQVRSIHREKGAFCLHTSVSS